MAALRFLLLRRRMLTACLFAAALAVRLLVPGGYMVGGGPGRLTIELCSGAAEQPMAAMPGMAEHDKSKNGGGSKDHGKAEMPCAFSGLAAAALGAIDPIQLAALIAFIVAVGLAVAPVPAPRRRLLLRPPLRGPPLPF